MKTKLISIFAILLLTAGCASMDSTEKGAAAGAVAGAGLGGIIGHQSGHGWEGAAIGGATGVLAGGLVGHQMDKNSKTASAGQLSVIDIAKMGDDKVPSSVIISEIDRTKSIYQLDTEGINYLKNHGISDTVIDHMLHTSK